MTDVTDSAEYSDHRKECEEIFLKTAQFYKSIMAGVIFLVGILSGSVAYAISATSQMSEQRTQLQSVDKRISNLETKFDGIDVKLDKIYEVVRLTSAE